MQKLRFGIIGCGSIIPKHLKAIVDNIDSVQLCAICDVVPEKLEATLKEYEKLSGASAKEIKEYTDYHELLQDPGIDAVTISTISGLRPKMALDALDAGKHIILEKPMALSIKNANAIIQKSKEKNLKVQICHQLRFLPHMISLKKAMEGNAFGKLVHAVTSIRWNRNDAYYSSASWRGTWKYDGGALMNQFIHPIDLLLWTMGPVKEVYGKTGTFLRKIEAEDAGMALVKFENGALGVIEGSVCVYPKNLEESLNIFGEKGTVCVGGKALNEVRVWEFADSQYNNFNPNQENVPINPHSLLYKDMIDSILSNRSPLIDAAEGKKAVELILAIYKSSKIGQPVKLPLEDFAAEDMLEEKL